MVAAAAAGAADAKEEGETGHDGEEADVADVVAQTGARRLLKGGTGGSSGGSGAGRGTTGASAWGASTPQRTTVAATATSTRSYGGRTVTYGGRSSYYAGGRYYYGGYRPYGYYYGSNVFLYGAVFSSVGYGGYGCYSCAGSRRTCRECSNCDSRSSCGAYASTMAQSNLDRYQLDVDFVAPANAAEWPLALRMYNVTVFEPQTTGASAARTTQAMYVNFFTGGGDTYESLSGTLSPLGWLGTIVCLVVIFCNRKSLCPDQDEAAGHRSSGGRTQNSHNPGNVHPETELHPAVPGFNPYGQPMQPSAVAPPMAYATAMPVAHATAPIAHGTALPVAQAHLPGGPFGHGGQMPVAQGVASYPPSPPTSAPTSRPTTAWAEDPSAAAPSAGASRKDD